MTTMEASSTEATAIVVPSRFGRRAAIQTAIAVVIFVVAMFVLPALTSTFWVKNFTSGAILAIVAAATGMLYGRVGLVALGQVALYGVGTWVTMRLGFATDWPYPVLILVAGLITAVIGTLLGLPALRLHGLYLALVTLMAAAAFLIILANTKFPSGGPGFRGVVVEVANSRQMRRPDVALTDYGYYRYVLVTAVILFGLAGAHLISKPGRAWASIRQSEAAALAAGVNTVTYKLWAWALASFMTGLCRCAARRPCRFTVDVHVHGRAEHHPDGRRRDGWCRNALGRPGGRADRRRPPGAVAEVGILVQLEPDPVRLGLLTNLLITSWQLDKAGIKE